MKKNPAIKSALLVLSVALLSLGSCKKENIFFLVDKNRLTKTKRLEQYLICFHVFRVGCFNKVQYLI
jgi:hypothetical protein